MRSALWPDADVSELAEEIAEGHVGEKPSAVFVAARKDGRLGGLVEVATRAYADGCDTSPVGYLEGLYVDSDLRRQGVARALVEVAEKWARQQGYAEIGSDCRIDNSASEALHAELGYEEKERIICFAKRLDSR